MLIATQTFGASDVAAQSITLEYQQVVTRLIPGATAAFSLDPTRVGASAKNGVVTLVGRGPGSTNVIVIIGDRSESLQVRVGEPPITRLPGMLNGKSPDAGSGYYEARYGSDPGIVQNSLFASRRQGDRSTELTLGSAVPIGDVVGPAFSIPLASFTLNTPNREITLLDRVISNSPLTISRSNVRGLHLRDGPWQMHAGYSFFSTFEHLLLPTNKEVVAGVGYEHRLSPRSSLRPNVYYFDGTASGGRSGPLGTLLFQTRTASDVKFVAELGVSRVLGGSIELEVDRPNRRAWAKLRVAPAELPSLTTDRQSGRQLEGGWSWRGDNSSLNATGSSRRYMQEGFGHASTVAGLDLQRRLTPAWAIHGGTGVSIFENASTASRIRSLTLPVGTSFSHRNMAFDAGYQFSRETTRNLGGHLLRANLNGSAGGVRVSVFGERQTHAPTARQILTEIPWLQPMLDRLGLAADTPQQLADLLRTNAELSAYGYANSVQIDLTPIRTRLGASGGWSGSGASRPQLFASTLVNRDDSIDRTSLGAVHSLSYSQRLNPATEIFLNWSALCYDRIFSPSSCRPVMSASLRRALSSDGGILVARRGHIDGIVFQDDLGQGMHTPGLPPLTGVEVVLDGVRHTRTDGSGRFRFDDVPYGRHLVEARYTSLRPIFFTTPSPAYVDTGGFVHFGIALSRSSLRGVVRSDAGLGLSGVVVHIRGAERQITIRTSDDGTFVAEGLWAGEYDVTIEAGSVPAGYPVDTLTPQRVRVGETAPGRATFVLRPYRTVSGLARLFNRKSGQYVNQGTRRM
jgi:hypothetical protein